MIIDNQNAEMFDDIDVNNLTQEEVENLNVEIKKTNQALFTEFINNKKQQIAQDFYEYVSQLDKIRIESIKNENFDKNTQKLNTEKQQITIDPADPQFVETLQNVFNYLESVEQMTKNCQKIDQVTQIRMLKILEKNKQILMNCKLQENWIFKETQEVQNFMADYFEILFSLRQEISNLQTKSFLCGSSKKKGTVKINQKLNILEMKFPGFQLLFNLKPRMKNHITKIVGDKQIIPPPEMDLNQEDFEQLIENVIQDQFPEQIPLINLKIKNEVQVEVKENVKTVYQKQEKSNYLIGQEFLYGFNQPQNYQKAIEYFLLAEKQGVSQASNQLGNIFFKGLGVQKDYTRAHQHYLKSATAMNPDGLYHVGYLIENKMVPGFTDQERISVAKDYYLKAANKNHSEALTDLAFFYENGISQKIDEQKALQLYQKAVNLNNPRAMNNLASLLLKIKSQDQGQNQRKAFELFQKSANMNYLNGITNLAICYLKGLGTTKDINRAKDNFEKAAQQNDPDSIFHLAYFKLKEANNYSNEESYQQAIQLLRKTLAFQSDHSDANYYMGYLSENGLGVNQDYKIAYQYYLIASQSSQEQNSKALFKLGNLLCSGKGCDFPDQQQGLYYYKKAAELGDRDALNKLGQIYEQGNFVQQDFFIAKDFYEQAILKNSNEAKVNLAFLMKNNLCSQNLNQEGVSEKLLYEAAQQGDQRAQSFINGFGSVKRQKNSFIKAQQFLKNKENEFQTLKLYQQNNQYNQMNNQKYNLKYVSEFIKL